METTETTMAVVMLEVATIMETLESTISTTVQDLAPVPLVGWKLCVGLATLDMWKILDVSNVVNALESKQTILEEIQQKYELIEIFSV